MLASRSCPMTQPPTTPKRSRVGKRMPLISAFLAIALLLNLVAIQFASAAGAGSDNLASAFDFSALAQPFNDSIDTTTATRDAGEIGNCGSFPITGSTHSVWYQYAAAADGWMTANTIGSNYDTVLEIFSGPAAPTFATLTSVSCNDDAASGKRQSEVTIPISAGTRYYI